MFVKGAQHSLMASASELAAHPSPSDDAAAAAAAAPTPSVTDEAAPVADAEENTEGAEATAAAEGSAAAETAAPAAAGGQEEGEGQGPPRLHAFQQSVLDMKDPEAQTKCVQLQRVSLAAMYTTSEELQEFNKVSEVCEGGACL